MRGWVIAVIAISSISSAAQPLKYRNIQMTAEVNIFAPGQDELEEADGLPARLPICVPNNSPFGWKYRGSSDLYGLEYLGTKPFGRQLMGWSSGTWVRLSARDKVQGMHCSSLLGDTGDNAIHISLDRTYLSSSLKYNHQAFPMERVIVMLSAAQTSLDSQKVSGVITFSSPDFMSSDVLRLELWERAEQSWRRVSSFSEQIFAGKTVDWKVTGVISKDAQATLVFGFGDEGIERITAMKDEYSIVVRDAQLAEEMP